MSTFFDSDDIPLVTRVEAGPGIIITYNSNDEGEGVWKATIDSDHINLLINKKVNDSDFEVIKNDNIYFNDRISELEKLLGVDYSNPYPITITQPDSDLFNYIAYSQSPTNLSQELIVKWQIIGVDGVPITSKLVTFAKNSTQLNVLNSLTFSIQRDAASLKCIEKFRLDDDTKIHYRFRPGFTNHMIKIIIMQTSDVSKFTVV